MTSRPFQVESVAIEMVVDLVNEYADITRLAADETGHPYPTLKWTVAMADGARDLVNLANDLYPMFAKPKNAIPLLNDLADLIGLTHRLNSAGELVWTQPAGSNRLQAAAAISLIDFISHHGTDPFGTCNAPQCADVYIDRSQAQARTYCSQRCNNRTRAARWRARHNDSRPSPTADPDDREPAPTRRGGLPDRLPQSDKLDRAENRASRRTER